MEKRSGDLFLKLSTLTRPHRESCMWWIWQSELPVENKRKTQCVSSYCLHHLNSLCLFCHRIPNDNFKSQQNDTGNVLPEEEQWGIHQRCYSCKTGNLSNQKPLFSAASLLNSTGWKYSWWSKRENIFTWLFIESHRKCRKHIYQLLLKKHQGIFKVHPKDLKQCLEFRFTNEYNISIRNYIITVT